MSFSCLTRLKRDDCSIPFQRQTYEAHPTQTVLLHQQSPTKKNMTTQAPIKYEFLQACIHATILQSTPTLVVLAFNSRNNNQ